MQLTYVCANNVHMDVKMLPHSYVPLIKLYPFDITLFSFRQFCTFTLQDLGGKAAGE
jgi:hypothetical protein